MLNRAILFFALAVVAGIFGFFGVIVTGAIIAKVLFVVFFSLFISSFFVRRRISE